MIVDTFTGQKVNVISTVNVKIGMETQKNIKVFGEGWVL